MVNGFNETDTRTMATETSTSNTSFVSLKDKLQLTRNPFIISMQHFKLSYFELECSHLIGWEVCSNLWCHGSRATFFWFLHGIKCRTASDFIVLIISIQWKIIFKVWSRTHDPALYSHTLYTRAIAPVDNYNALSVKSIIRICMVL